MKQTILITGSNGLLGQKIIYNYRNRPDIDLIATARGECRIAVKDGYTYAQMDITNPDEVKAVFEKHKPDAVINAAAMTNVDACESAQEEAWQLNVVGVENLIAACENHNTHLVHVSTDFIFDGKDGPYTEEAEANPLSYYGLTKWEAEKRVMKMKGKWSIARTVLVIGITPGLSRSNIVLWVKNSLEAKKAINVVNDQFRTPTLAEDLADGCMRIAMQGKTGVYNISGFELLSIIDMAHKIAQFYKLDKSLITPVSSETLNQPAKRPPKTGFIVDKAIRDLGYKPHSFDESLAIIHYQTENN